MRSQVFKWVLTAGLMATTLVGTVELASAQPNVRDHRRGSPGPGPGPGPGQVDRGPREAPPAPRAERRGKRRGHVWVDGHWDWRGNRWQWTAGRWERERAGKRWRADRWDQRDGAWIKVSGDWEDYDDRPRVAPPAPRQENRPPRRGFVWIAGHYEWSGGEWNWVAGRYERKRPGNRWRQARWEQRNGVWIKLDGDWEIAPQYPSSAPPPPRAERSRPRRGFTFVSGRWDWRDGEWAWTPGRYERQLPNRRWNDGRWEQRDGRWQWSDGGWADVSVSVGGPGGGVSVGPGGVNVGGPGGGVSVGVNVSGGVSVTTTGTPAMYPNAAPPPPRAEVGGQRRGYVFVRGHWDWRNNNWEWLPGRWERARANQRWNDGRWEQQNGRWQWIEGGWGTQAPPPPPTPAPPPVAAPPMTSGPTMPPPAPRAETGGTRAGYLFVRGHYEWRNNQYEWIPGHWERAKARMRWVDARWERRGNTWVFTAGGWR